MKKNILITLDATQLIWNGIASFFDYLDHTSHQIELKLFTPQNISHLKFQKTKQVESLEELSSTHFDLIINLNTSLRVDDFFAKLTFENIVGIIPGPSPMINNRWCSTFLAQLSLNHFSPFSPADIFSNMILEDFLNNLIDYKNIKLKEVIVDLDSMEENLADSFESFLIEGNKSLSDYKLTTFEKNASIQQSSLYIGQDFVQANKFAIQGACVIFIGEAPKDATSTLAGQFSYLFSSDFFQDNKSIKKVIADVIRVRSEELSNKDLGHNIGANLDFYKNSDSENVFYIFDYIIFSYFNSLKEVNLLPPSIPLKDIQSFKELLSVMDRVDKLNKFAIKYIDHFLSDIEQTKEKRKARELVKDISSRISEIDQLTLSALGNYPQLSLLKHYYQFRKSCAAGEGFTSVCKSLILIYHEMNQAIQGYQELAKKVMNNSASEIRRDRD